MLLQRDDCAYIEPGVEYQILNTTLAHGSQLEGRTFVTRCDVSDRAHRH